MAKGTNDSISSDLSLKNVCCA